MKKFEECVKKEKVLWYKWEGKLGREEVAVGWGLCWVAGALRSCSALLRDPWHPMHFEQTLLRAHILSSE
eukprot:5484681-Amphidinium_carterae.1